MSQRSILLTDYARLIEPTDKFRAEDIKPILLGLFGEVGSIMATAKKHRRENDAYIGYKSAVEEEFGDALWYLAALCRRLAINFDDIFTDVLTQNDFKMAVAATDLSEGQISQIACIDAKSDLEIILLQLGVLAADLLMLTPSSKDGRKKVAAFAHCYTHALHSAGVTFAQAAHKNIAKARGRFLKPDIASLSTFDLSFPEDEQLPKQFEIKIIQRNNGRCYLQWNGVFIGDPLTDNIADRDGYRFHDVFHFAHAAVLHWSPTFRALIKHKRKSCNKTDEEQDSGRAIVVEEGLTAFIFSRAKELNLFEGQESISFDLLKTVQQFTAGYEVTACPLWQWEAAILQGYKVFRQVLANNGGIVIGNRDTRTVMYKPL